MTRCQHHTSITVEIRKLCTHTWQVSLPSRNRSLPRLLAAAVPSTLLAVLRQATVTTDCHAKRTAALCCQPVAQARSNLPNRLLCQCHLLFSVAIAIPRISEPFCKSTMFISSTPSCNRNQFYYTREKGNDIAFSIFTINSLLPLLFKRNPSSCSSRRLVANPPLYPVKRPFFPNTR